MPSSKGTRFTEGLDVLANRSLAPVRVTGVEWQNADGLETLEVSYLHRRPDTRFATFGIWNGFPPDDLGSSPKPLQEAWRERQPLLGASLPPNEDAGDYYNIVIGFSGARGSAGPLRVTYVDDSGHEGYVDTLVTMATREHCG